MDPKRTVGCPLEGLTGVSVTYNLMATAKQLDAFRATLNTETAAPVVARIDGWEAGTEPLSDDAPMAFRYWVGYGGWQAAVKTLLDDPLFSMRLTGSMPATPAGA